MRLSRFTLVFALCGFCLAGAVSAENYNVRTFGATGDGTNLDTAAFQATFDACAAADGGIVVVPSGNYLIGSIKMAANTTLQLEPQANLIGSSNIADYPLVSERYENQTVQVHRALILAENANDIAITGSGTITGPPLELDTLTLSGPRGPLLIELIGCTNVTLDGFSTHYQRLWSIHPLFCQNVTIKNLTIRATLVNGDGIDVESCRNMTIENCDINAGDDAISLKSGRGESAVRADRPTANVIIKNCKLFSSNFAGLGIGTELSGGIENTLIENCTISGHQNGIFLKSRDGRGGYIKDFTGINLTVINSPTFLNIDLLNKGIQAADPVTGETNQWTQLSNISFKHIRVDHVSYLLHANQIPPQRPIDGFTLADVQGNCGKAMNMAYMNHVVLSGINVTNYQGPLLTASHVEGKGVSELQPVVDP
ncbi:MAG TPA: glycoside hydrolase family 28 protein [Verrucomicrobiae bacterium]|jgi:polygalacturonase